MPMTTDRSIFRGFILGVGSVSGVRVVVGHWTDTPLGEFSDAMVETAAGHRVLLAPRPEVAEFIAGTYVFDETRVEPFRVDAAADRWSVRSPSLSLDLGIGRRTPIGGALRAVPRAWAESPAWCAVTDPVARLLLRGVRTRGVARAGGREWYGATDVRTVTSLSGTFDGVALGALAPVEPPCGFGFSSTPRRPAVTTVVTTVERSGVSG
jgi:hypothetical protein